MTQGKCNACRLVYEWQGKPLLRDASCPVHLTPLRRTSRLHYFARRRIANPLAAMAVPA